MLNGPLAGYEDRRGFEERKDTGYESEHPPNLFVRASNDLLYAHAHHRLNVEQILGLYTCSSRVDDFDQSRASYASCSASLRQR